MSNGKITIIFECTNADEVLALSIVYELIELQYKPDYDASFAMKKLPSTLRHIIDIIGDRLDGNMWHVGDPVFEFEDSDTEFLNSLIAAQKEWRQRRKNEG